MEQITVNQVRVRLGKIMQPILCDALESKYERALQDGLLPCDCDELVLSASESLQNPDRFRDVLTAASDVIFFSFFLRYHTVTQHLIKQPQDSLISVPEGRKAFFVFVFSELWETNSEPLST